MYLFRITLFMAKYGDGERHGRGEWSRRKCWGSATAL